MRTDNTKQDRSTRASLGRHRRTILAMAAFLSVTLLGFLILLGVLLYRIATAGESDAVAMIEPLHMIVFMVG